jgi:uncharacterized protein YjbI with pentapeptide repeats
VIPRGLTSRWLSPDGRSVAADIIFRLFSGEPIFTERVSTHEGRVDLRGFSIPLAEVEQMVHTAGFDLGMANGTFEIRAARWTNLDFSGAKLSNLRFFDSILDNCIFDSAECRDWRLWNSSVRDSSFVKANLRDSAVGTWHDEKFNSWDNVSFAHADLRGSIFKVAHLTECDFAFSRLDSVHFSQCVLSGIRFAGALRDVLFDGREAPGRWPNPGPMHNVDFSGATLIDVDFRGCRFESVDFGTAREVVVIPNFPKVARRELELIEGDESPETRQIRAVLENELKNPGTEDTMGVFVRADWARAGGDGLASLAESVLRRALEETS